jgi:hypothetical protein
VPISTSRRLATLALAALAAAAAAAPGAAAPRMSILYDERTAVRALTRPSGPGAPIGAERGAYRQDPGPGGIFDPRGRDGAYRIAKVPAAELAALSAEAMAQRIRREVDRPQNPNRSGLVAVDEIGNPFNDRRGGAGGPGARLSRAMAILAGIPHRAGGDYADRVHLYVAPAFGSSIAAGLGPHHNLGRDGKPHRATWRRVMPALARAGGVWLEMYHGSRAAGLTPMSAREWRTLPRDFLAYHARFGGDVGLLHLVLSEARVAPAGAPAGCGGPMACQWRLARSTAAGRTILANGPGAYRLGAQAIAWRAQYNRAFGGA